MFQFSSLLARTEAEREPRRSKHVAPPADSMAVEIHPNASLVTDELASTSNACVSARVRRDLDEQMQRLADLLDRVESLDVERDGAIDEMLAVVEASTGEPAASKEIDDRPLAVPHEFQPSCVELPQPGPADAAEPPVLTITPLPSPAPDSMSDEPAPCCEVILGDGNACSLADLPAHSNKGGPTGQPCAKAGFMPRRPFHPAARADTAPVALAAATAGLVQQFPAIGNVAEPTNERGQSNSLSASCPHADDCQQSRDSMDAAEFPSRDVLIGESIVQTVLADHPAGPYAIGLAATPVVLVEDGPTVCFKSGEPSPPAIDLAAGGLGNSTFSSQNVWDGRSTVETLFQPLPCTARSLGSPATAVVLVEAPLAETPSVQADSLRVVDIPANLTNPSFPSRQVWDCRSTVETLCPPLPRTASALGSPNPSVVVVDGLPSECKQHVEAADSSYGDLCRHAGAAPLVSRQLATGRSVVQTVFSACPSGPAEANQASTNVEACGAAAPSLGVRSGVRHGASLTVLQEPAPCKAEERARPTLVSSLPVKDRRVDREVEATLPAPVAPAAVTEPTQEPTRRPLRTMRLAEVEAAAASTAVEARDSTALNILAALGGMLTLAALVYVAADLASWL